MERCCKNCKCFDDRTKFCRAKPPVPTVVRSEEETRDFILSKYPVIVYPETDWCEECFVQIEESEDTLLTE